MVRLLLNWDLKPEKEAGFMEFIAEDFTRSLTKLGLHVTDFWATTVGRGPQYLFVAAAEDLETIHKIMASKEWLALHGRLMTYVFHFQQKVVPLHARFQL